MRKGVKTTFLVYFTLFSDNIYKVSNSSSNLALYGIAVRLQKPEMFSGIQIFFWFIDMEPCL